MRGVIAAALLGAAVVLPAVPAHVWAQGTNAPVAAPAADEAHSIARTFLEKAGIAAQLDAIVASTRQVMIVAFKTQGIDEARGADIVDRFMMPEFRARAPELMDRFADVLVADFTLPELRAILSRDNPDALRSAQAKLPKMQADFASAGQAWGNQVGADVYAKNRAELDKLGVKSGALSQ